MGNNIEAKRTLIATYIEDGNYFEAASTLAELPLDNEEISDWVQFNDILLNLHEQDKALYNLNETDIEFICIA